VSDDFEEQEPQNQAAQRLFPPWARCSVCGRKLLPLCDLCENDIRNGTAPAATSESYQCYECCGCERPRGKGGVDDDT
jgi:uncharacterized protein with PIN domain